MPVCRGSSTRKWLELASGTLVQCWPFWCQSFVIDCVTVEWQEMFDSVEDPC